MEIRDIVEQARRGDSDAFDRLVAHYRDMALGYAKTLIRDEGKAEDAVQEALLVAHRKLDRLKDSDAFQVWLRGIVRNRCLHVKAEGTLPLEESLASPQPADELGLTEAIEELPESQKLILGLFYVEGLSQAEIGRSLGLTVATVNMRMHAARERLRRRLIVNETINSGRIESVDGALVTIRFAGAAPKILAKLASDFGALCVLRTQPDGTVQAASSRSGAIWTPGQEVRDTGEAFLDALPDQVAIDVAGRGGGQATALQSGIKSIDIFAPLMQGGKAGVFAEWGVGTLVLLPELLQRLDDGNRRQSFYAFFPALQNEKQWQDVNAEAPVGSGKVEIYYIPVRDPISGSFVNAVTGLDAKLVLSRTLAEQGIYPSIDPIRSSSAAHDSARASVIADAQELIRRYYELQFSMDPEDAHSLTQEDWTTIRRARLATRFLSQPFYVAEPYTGIPGVTADPSTALETLRGILSGTYDDLHASAFMMTGDTPKSD